MDVHDVFVADPRGVPHGVDQLAAAERQAGLGGQDVEDVELGAGEGDGVVADPHFVAGGVDAQVAEHTLILHRGGGGGWAAGAPQHGLDAGDEFAVAERLGEVVVGPHGQSDEPVDLVAASSQDQDVAVREGADLAAHLDAVEPGQPEVEHDHIGVLGPRLGDGVGTGVGLSDVVACPGEVGRDDGGECAFVIDDQHLGRLCTFAVHVSQYGRDPLSTGELGRAPGRVLMRS